MSELDAKPELQASTTANGSGPPGDTGLEAISEKKGEEENGTRAVEEEAEGKRKKQNEGMKMTEAKDVKVSEAVDAKAQGVQDVAMMGAVGAKVVEVEEVALQESEETKTVEGEQVNVQDVEDMKMREIDNIKMLGGEDLKIAEAEDVKMQEAEDEKMPEIVDVTMAHAGEVKMIETEDTKKILEAKDVKRQETEAEKMLTSEGAKVLEAEEDTKDQEQKINGEEKEEGMEESMGREGEKSTKKEEDSKEAKGSKEKWVRGKGLGEEGEGKAKKEGVAKEKELLSTPRASSTERPVRERKTVERLVEVLEKEQVKKFVIEKGSGTPLKDIPNVAHKLARKKPADLKLLHQMLFGRIGKAVDFKNHILQFSGFVWHESEEKQKTRIKEKLDKYVKDTLLDLCDLFDIPVPKATTRKEELVAMLLDFMAAPHATTNVILTEKEQQSTKSRKRKRVGTEGASKFSIVIPAKWSRKKRTKNEGTRKAKGKSDYESADDVEEEGKENALPEGDEAFQHSESDKKETEPGEEAEDNENNGGVSRKSKLSLKRTSRRGGSSSTEKLKVISIPKKAVLPSTTKSPSTRLASEQSKADEGKNAGAKVFSRKTKSVDPPKKKSTSSKLDWKEKATGKMAVKGKAKSKETKESGPSKDELRKAIGEILKEVDFNTVTFTDILKQLAKHYNMDLTPRKASIKIIIQEELTKLADEAEENEEDEAGGTDKDGNPELRGREIEA